MGRERGSRDIFAAVSERVLEGRGAVVTGGGRGIGAATARALAEAGAAVVVAARSVEQIERTASELRDLGHRAWAVACDVTDPDRVTALRAAAEGHLGAVDILVNNAGVAHSAPLKAITLELWNQLFLVTDSLPNTVPPAAVLVGFELWSRRRR